MKDKTEKELIEDIKLLQNRIKELEILDIKHTHMEEAVIRSKKEWERTFDIVPDLIALIDKEHRIIRVNKAMALKLNTTPDQLVGHHCYEVIHKLYSPPDFCPHAKLMSSGKEELVEVMDKHLEGFFEIRVAPICDDNNQLIGSVHIIRDITKRKQAEEMLKLSEEKFSITFNLSPILMSISRLTDGKFISVNDYFCEILGFTKDEVIGHMASELNIWISQEQRNKSIAMLKESKYVRNMEIKLRKKNGDICTMIWSSQLINFDGIPHLLSVGNDITERKKVEEEKEKQIKELEIFYKASIGREERIIELKKIIEQLKKELRK